MDVSGAGSPSASMLANIAIKTETSVAVQKKEMEMEKQTAAQLIASIEQSAPKANASGSIGGNIDVMV
ncbi:MAG: putative motility protein [Candidatus Thiodiazotropha sp. (ex Cardiolucina cf. quadrata)]|nr:putative motility protein [Candidatus Thiodiazotropha sp. (ex Cardiolucina cf. quadrata)]